MCASYSNVINCLGFWFNVLSWISVIWDVLKSKDMTKTLKLNCDLGESFGSWQMGMDDAVMPHIDMANIACGFHAGDPNIMLKTLKLAHQYQTEVGAHPSYPDLQGFGRRSLNCSSDEITNMVIYQVGALVVMAKTLDVTVTYVKPHGAMYNDMMKSMDVRHAIMHSVHLLNKTGLNLKLMMLATDSNAKYIDEAKAFGVTLLFESFADRRYTDNGTLQARTEKGSVLGREDILIQVKQLLNGEVTTASGQQLAISSDTICVHGDNSAGVKLVSEIRELCDSHQRRSDELCNQH